MEQSRNKKLAKDIAIYGIGNIGSKMLTFMLYPILSFLLIGGDFGYYDVALSTILFLLPITTLQMRESLFRMLINENDVEQKKKILSTTLYIEFIIFTIILVASITINFISDIKDFWLIIISLYIYSFYELYQQVVRVLYSSKQFAIIGIITSFLTVFFVIILITIFNMKVEGVFIGNILARVVAMLIIETKNRGLIKNFSIKYINHKHIKSILNYSFPMLLTDILMGFITTFGKYVIKYTIGIEDNAYLAISEKFASIIAILGVTVYQAWQESAVKNFNEKDSSIFFSKIFNKYSLFLSLLIVCVSFGLRSFSFIINKDYEESINIIYAYSTIMIFYCLALFFMITYQCAKQTSKLLPSTLSCAVLTPIVSYLAISKFGLYGYIFSVGFAYIYLFLFRYFQTKSMLPIKLNKNFYTAILILIAGGYLFYGINNKYLDYSILLGTSIYLLFTLKSLRK